MALRQRITLEEFLEWPDKRPYREYINGEVKAKAVPNAEHSLLQTKVASSLEGWDPDGFVVTEQRCLLQARGRTQVVLPDVAWFPTGTFALNDKKQAIAPPRLAVEIVSPDDSYGDVEEKVHVYLEAGVRLVWVIDPVARNVTIHRKGQQAIVLSEQDGMKDEALPGFSLTLPELFRKLDLLPDPRTEEQP